MFSYYKYILEIKQNNEGQIIIILKRIYVINKIISLVALYHVKNFKPYKKYLYFLLKIFDIVIKNILVFVFAL